VAFLAACGGEKSVPQSVLPQATSTVVAPVTAPPTGSAIPVLTGADKERIRAIALADPRLQEILAGRKYDVSEPFLWHTSRLQLIGGGIVITFLAPFSREGEWPVVSYDRSEAAWPPFQSVAVHFRAEDIETLRVNIDLTRGELVGIDPYDAQISDYTPPANFTPYPTSATPYD
jgi:hypothetical protein